MLCILTYFDNSFYTYLITFLEFSRIIVHVFRYGNSVYHNTYIYICYPYLHIYAPYGPYGPHVPNGPYGPHMCPMGPMGPTSQRRRMQCRPAGRSETDSRHCTGSASCHSTSSGLLPYSRAVRSASAADARHWTQAATTSLQGTRKDSQRETGTKPSGLVPVSHGRGCGLP